MVRRKTMRKGGLFGMLQKTYVLDNREVVLKKNGIMFGQSFPDKYGAFDVIKSTDGKKWIKALPNEKTDYLTAADAHDNKIRSDEWNDPQARRRIVEGEILKRSMYLRSHKNIEMTEDQKNEIRRQLMSLPARPNGGKKRKTMKRKHRKH